MNEVAKPTAEKPVEDNRPSVLFASPMSVLDITSGAALSMRTFLSALAARGFRSVALQATLFDSAQGGEHVNEASDKAKDKDIVKTRVLGVEHIIVKTKAVRRPDMTCMEQERYIRSFRNEIINRRPDMIILWGGMLLEMSIMREAREAGIPVFFYLVNSGYKNKDTFKYASAIVTDTQATANMYKERHNLTCYPIGKFIDPKLFKAPRYDRKYITFINPSFEKGVNVFLPLAKLAAKECPEINFLVVQSRGRWGVALKVLGFKPDDFPNVTVIGHQKDMRKVYANTKVLLLPSTWYESGARVIAESLINGIPVFASDTGGSSELVGDAGELFQLSKTVQDEKTTAATEDDVRPWLEAVKKVWHDEDYYKGLCEKVEIEAKNHDIQTSVDRFLAVREPVIERTRKDYELQLKQREQYMQASSTNAKDVMKQALQKKNAKQAKRNKKSKK
ncbi:MAG: glycosyltransferase family 4 protein [Pseudohongiellaceae bacterium]|nr:glycosyltransferase family 4 protein [Pseudohongiellaceae bacterium]